MSSIFGFYFIVGLLNAAGWPRRHGLFNSEAVYNCSVLDSAIIEMITWSASIGAFYPNLALQVISSIFREVDWDSESSPSLINLVKDLKKSWKERDSDNPISIVKPVKFSRADNIEKIKNEVISVKDFKDKRMQLALEQYFLEGLIWGLLNPIIFKRYFENKEKEQRAKLPEYKQAGLEIDSLPTLEQFLKDGQKILKSYEKEIRPLSPIPAKLSKEALSLGIKFN